MSEIYTVIISARREGAIGQHGTEHRTYEIEASNPEFMNELAIRRAYREGGLEHIKVIEVVDRDAAEA